MRTRRVRGVHDRIHGPIDEDGGRYHRGQRYTAHDEGSLLWVHATLVETTVMAYELGIATLSPAEKEAYYQESKLFGALFGISEEALPPDWPAFKRYCEDMAASDALAVGRPARETARFLLSDTRAMTRPFMRVYSALTTGLLPPRIREEYGLPFGPAEEATYRGTLRAVKRVWPLLPDRTRWVPDYVEARRRLAGRPREDRLGRSVQQMILSSVRPRS